MPRQKKEIKPEPLPIAQEIRAKVRDQTLSYITAAFGLVAGLAWNEAIKSAIENIFVLNQDSIWAKFIYAAILTLVLVAVTVYLNYLFKREVVK